MGPALAVLGDSLLEGLADVRTNRILDPWPALLSDALSTGRPGPTVRSWATRGARVADVLHHQLPHALAREHQLAAVWAGLNDAVAGRLDTVRLAEDLGAVLGSLTAAGVTVLTAEMPLARESFPVPAAVIAALDRRIARVNEVTRALAVRHGTVHLRLGADGPAPARHWFGPDCAHFSATGHAVVAEAYRSLLQGSAPVAVPVAPQDDLTDRERLRWLAGHGLRWAAGRWRRELAGALGGRPRSAPRRPPSPDGRLLRGGPVRSHAD